MNGGAASRHPWRSRASRQVNNERAPRVASSCPLLSELNDNERLYGNAGPSCRRQIILCVSECLRLSTSCTRLRLPMKGMRVTRLKPILVHMILDCLHRIRKIKPIMQ